MKRIWSALASILIIADTPAVAFERNVANWTITSNEADSAGDISVCGMRGNYRSGINLTFVLSTAWKWALVFDKPDWRLTEGERYTIQYFIDRGPVVSAEARAIGADTIFLDLPDTGTNFREFQRGRVLTVLAASQKLEFALQDTAIALETLGECVSQTIARETSRRAVTSNPFAPPQYAPSPNSGVYSAPKATNRQPALDAEAMTLASNIVSLASFQGASFSVPEAISIVNAEWRTEDAYGAIIVRPDIDDADVIAADVIATDAKACRGKFASGTPGNENVALRRVFTVCEQDGKNIAIQYVLASRSKGGTYVIGIGGTGGQSSEAAERVYPILLRAAESGE